MGINLMAEYEEEEEERVPVVWHPEDKYQHK